MVRIGIIGIGFMGYTHFTAAAHLNGAAVTAFATRDPKKRSGDWRGIQGNFGPPASQIDVSQLKTFEDYRDLLNDDEIDLVDICLPPDMHEQVAIEALQAGKAVFVEKPIAISAESADRMVEAAETAGRPLLVGQVLPFFPEFRYAADVVRSGQYGKLHAAHFRRVICPPNWSEEMSDFRKLGGWGIDLHIHDNHFISVLCGVPRAVFSRGTLKDGFVNHVHTQYLFDDPQLAVSCVSGGIAAQALQFSHGFEIFLEHATLQFTAGTVGGEWVVDRPLTVLTNDGQVTHPDLQGSSEWYAAFTAELQAAVNCLETGVTPRTLSGALARDALKLCYAEAESIQRSEVISL